MSNHFDSRPSKETAKLLLQLIKKTTLPVVLTKQSEKQKV